MCVWVSGASLDSLSPGPQHRHRGRLRHVSLPPRRSQAELSRFSKEGADVEAESSTRYKDVWQPAHAGPGQITATQPHRGCIAASASQPRARAGAVRRCCPSRGEQGGGDGAPAPARRRGLSARLSWSRLLLTLPAARCYFNIYLRALFTYRGMRKIMYRPIGVPRDTHTVSHGGELRKDDPVTARRPQSESPHSAGHHRSQHMQLQLCTD